jgi:hypothetical protein
MILCGTPRLRETQSEKHCYMTSSPAMSNTIGMSYLTLLNCALIYSLLLSKQTAIIYLHRINCFSLLRRQDGHIKWLYLIKAYNSFDGLLFSVTVTVRKLNMERNITFPVKYDLELLYYLEFADRYWYMYPPSFINTA